MSFVVGLTGNIATGKSTMLRYLAERGARVLDADKLAHRAMEPGGPAYQPIMDEFGAGVVQNDGTIDRKALGRIVFRDPAALKRLECISHPAVYDLAQQAISATSAPLVVLEAIKLLEGATAALCDEIWVVTSMPETQLQRLMEQRGMSRADAQRRMAAQSPQADKVRQADRVIDNNGTRDALYAQLDAILADLERTHRVDLQLAESGYTNSE